MQTLWYLITSPANSARFGSPSSRPLFLTGAILGIFLPLLSASAQQNAPGDWGATATIGVMFWGNLDDLEPPGGGSFDSVGLAMEFAGHRHMTRWGSADVFAGPASRVIYPKVALSLT